MKKFLILSILFSIPFSLFAGFPEDEEGYDIEKITNSFKLPCKEIGKDKCISRSLGIGACSWIFQINKGIEQTEALRISDNVLIALLKGNNLDLNTIFEKDEMIKKEIKNEAIYRISFCNDAIKEAIPKMVKLPEGIELNAERIENLTNTFPMEYLRMFEVMKKR